jgi:hypothetical protein
MLMGLKSMGTADEAAAALATGKRDKSEHIKGILIESYSEPMSPVFSAIIRTSQLNPKRGHNK